MTEIRKTPQLRECTQDSLFGALVQSAQLGLEPGSALGHCYLIPYRNRKKNIIECQFQIGYKGMLDLARRSGQIRKLYAHCVFEADKFEVRFGLDEALVHVPDFEVEDRGRIVGAYAVAHLVGGGEQFVYLPWRKLQAIRDGSKAKDDGPWKTHEEEMCQKTAARALFKWLPVSIEAVKAAGLDEAADRGEQANAALLGEDDRTIDVDPETGEVLGPSSAADLNAALEESLS